MSFGISAATWVTIAATAASAAVQYNSSQQQIRAQERASQQAQQNALMQERAASEADNKANQRRPNTGSILDAASQAGRAGQSGTSLTGPSGIDPSLLQLGRNTLLGS